MDLRQETEDANVKNHIMEDFASIKTIVKRTKIVATKVYRLMNLFNHEIIFSFESNDLL